MKRCLTLLILASVGLVAFARCSGDRDGDATRSDAVRRARAARPARSSVTRMTPNVTVPVTTSVVSLAAVPITVSATGTVTGGANDRAALAFSEPGRIARVDVVVGQRVWAGETLARIDSGPLTADARQARAALAVARANYAKTAGGARPQAVAETSAQIQSARTQLAAARSNLARAKQLFSLGIAAAIDVETATSAVASARAQLEIDEQQQSAQVQPFAPDVAAARATVDEARAALSAAEQKTGYATLGAPFAGTVVARFHNDGETVDPSLPVVEIAKESGTVFTAGFAPADAQRIHRGDRATIVMAATNETAEGTVIAIDPLESAAVQTVPVLLRLARSGLAFGPGAYGTASIKVGSRRGLSVSSGAIVSDPTTGSAQVFRKVGDAYVPVAVKVEQQIGLRSAIASSQLHPGDVVVAQGSYELLAPSQSAPGDADGK